MPPILTPAPFPGEEDGGGGGGSPSGPAGGALAGTYPNPGFAVDMATQAEIDALEDLLVPRSLFDANTILAANSDDTPLALAVAASRFLGRKASGNIAAMTVAEALAELAAVEHVAPDFSATGINGATAGARLVGGIASGPATSGVVGDISVDRTNGCLYVCIVAGTPGTWVRVGGRNSQTTRIENYSAVAINTTNADAAGLTVALTCGGVLPVSVSGLMPSTAVTGGTGYVRMSILEGATLLAYAETQGALAATNVAGSIAIPPVEIGVPSAGVHTYKVMMRTVAATAGTYTSVAGGPAIITATEG